MFQPTISRIVKSPSTWTVQEGDYAVVNQAHQHMMHTDQKRGIWEGIKSIAKAYPMGCFAIYQLVAGTWTLRYAQQITVAAHRAHALALRNVA